MKEVKRILEANQIRISTKEDEFKWETKDKKLINFSIKEAYNAINPNIANKHTNVWKKLWTKGLTPKITSFAWEAINNGPFTLDNLKKRVIELANQCVMCLEPEESIQHLLHNSIYTTELQYGLAEAIGIKWTQPQTLEEWIIQWSNGKKGEKLSRVWNLMIPHLWWTV